MFFKNRFIILQSTLSSVIIRARGLGKFPSPCPVGLALEHIVDHLDDRCDSGQNVDDLLNDIEFA